MWFGFQEDTTGAGAVLPRREAGGRVVGGGGRNPAVVSVLLHACTSMSLRSTVREFNTQHLRRCDRTTCPLVERFKSRNASALQALPVRSVTHVRVPPCERTNQEPWMLHPNMQAERGRQGAKVGGGTWGHRFRHERAGLGTRAETFLPCLNSRFGAA